MHSSSQRAWYLYHTTKVARPNEILKSLSTNAPGESLAEPHALVVDAHSDKTHANDLHRKVLVLNGDWTANAMVECASRLGVSWQPITARGVKL